MCHKGPGECARTASTLATRWQTLCLQFQGQRLPPAAPAAASRSSCPSWRAAPTSRQTSAGTPVEPRFPYTTQGKKHNQPHLKTQGYRCGHECMREHNPYNRLGSSRGPNITTAIHCPPVSPTARQMTRRSQAHTSHARGSPLKILWGHINGCLERFGHQAVRFR